MADMLGEDFNETMMSGSPIHVITTVQKTKDTAAILNRDALSRFAREHEVDSLMVLPPFCEIKNSCQCFLHQQLSLKFGIL